MKKSQRIQTIVDIKAQQESNALKALGEQQNKAQAAKLQLEHLQRYRQEYLEQYSGNGVKRVQSLVDFRAFIVQLDVAIIGQENIVQQAEMEALRQRKCWENLHHNTKNLQKGCDGLVAAESKIANKREQVESDDRASRMSFNNSVGMENA